MKKLIALLMISAWLLPAVALAQVASITNFAATNPPLKVSFQVDGAFNTDIEEAIKSGLPASFNFFIKLEKVNSVFPNESVGEWEFRHTVKYNSLHDEYELTLDETGGKPLKIKNTEEMKKLMASCTAVSVEPAHLVPGANYRLRVKAELDSIDLPFILNNVFFFLEAFDFETDWHYYDFTHTI
jgi:hypothetical protein